MKASKDTETGYLMLDEIGSGVVIIPRERYEYLESCEKRLAELKEHLPKVREAYTVVGRWDIVEAMIQEKASVNDIKNKLIRDTEEFFNELENM